jgi:hypothetical protein
MISLFIEYDKRHKSNWLNFVVELSEFSGLGRVFGIATGYGLDSPGIESR